MEIGYWKGANGKYYVNWGNDGRAPYLEFTQSFKSKEKAMAHIKALKAQYGKTEKITFDKSKTFRSFD